MAGLVKHSDITVGYGSHGKHGCPHLIVGMFITGSLNVLTNSLPSVRTYTDIGFHTCPHCGVNMPIGGSPNILINSLPAHRLGDPVTEFCGMGITVTSSANVFGNGL